MIDTLTEDGDDFVLLPHVPDWTSPPSWTRRWQHQLATNLHGGEERVAMQDQGLVRLAWTIDPYDAVERGLAVALVTEAKKRGLAAAPYWGRGSQLADAGSGPALQLFPTRWNWRIGDALFIRQPARHRWQDWELASVALWNATTYTLTLTDPLGAEYPAGAMVWPLLFGIFDCDDLTALNDHHARLQVRILQRRPWPLNRLINDSCSIALSGTGSGDSFNCYTVQDPITQSLAAANGWEDPWVIRSLWFGPQAIETFEAYVLGNIVTLLNQGSGFTGAWTFRGRHIGVVAMETFNDYAEEDPITVDLEHGTGFTGAWTLRNLP